MSYPPPRYLGPDGEVTATHRPAGHEPELTYASGNTVHYLATGASTNGQFGLYRWEMGPATMLLHFAPGAPREGYFEGLPDLSGMSEEEKAEFFLRHDTFRLS